MRAHAATSCVKWSRVAAGRPCAHVLVPCSGPKVVYQSVGGSITESIT